MRPYHLILSVSACIILCGFTNEGTVNSAFQPNDERIAQDNLPKSKHELWGILGKTRTSFNEGSGLFTAQIPEEVKQLSGKEISITGFMLPLEAEDEFHHFLLSKRTPTCAFCPPGEPNEVIDITLKNKTEWLEELITVKGILQITDDREKGIFFTMKNAEISKP